MKRTSLLALLLMFGVLLASCNDEPGETVAVVAPTAPEPQRVSGIDLDDLEYETLSGTLQGGQSGGMYAYLTSWPRNCLFSLVVPETSMPGGGTINFTMSIPTQASYLDPEFAEALHERLIIRLAPDHEQFAGPIYVQGTWMPWDGVPPDTLWVHDGPDSSMATITQVGNRYRVSFAVDHFSDWEVGPEPR